MSYGRCRLYDGGVVAERGDVASADVAAAFSGGFSPDARRELATLRSINAQLVRQVALLRQREGEARRLAERDALTGLYNRRKMDDLLESALADASRQGQCVGLLLLDLDGFKAVNDTYGHSMGDKLLTQVATRLTGRARGADRVCRYGGDEFVVILPGIEGVGAIHEAGEHLARRVSTPYRIDGVVLRVTAAVGAAAFPQQALTAADLVRTADLAMYAAKAQAPAIAPDSRRPVIPARRREDR